MPLSRSRGLGRVARAMAAAALFTCSACKKDAPEPSKAERVEPDRNADGRRLSAALETFPSRWARLGDLPDCTALLEKADERQSCGDTQASLSALRAALAQKAATAELLQRIRETALAAQRATELLRASGVAELFSDDVHPEPGTAGPPAAAESSRAASGNAGAPGAVDASRFASGNAGTPGAADASRAAAHTPAERAPRASASRPPALAASSVASHSFARAQSNPSLSAIVAYSNVATLALRHLGAYLELGPLELRRAAYRELTELVKAEPHWAALRALAKEALLIESDPALKRQLKATVEQLGPG